MATLLGDLTTVATSVLSVVGQVTTQIVTTPFLLMTTGILLLGGAIGIMGRILSRN